MFFQSTLFHEIFNSVLLVGVFVANILIFDIPLKYGLLVSLSALSGSLILGYFRREKSISEQIVKTFCGAISAIFCGGAIVDYLGIIANGHIASIYFLSGLLSLFILQAAISLTEKNSKEIIISVLERIVFRGNTIETRMNKISIKSKKEDNRNGQT